MRKDKMWEIRDFIVRHCKIVFPVIVVAVVAVTVTVALNMSRSQAEASGDESETGVSGSDSQTVQTQVAEDVPMVANEDGDIYTLVATYYNAMALGDTETLLSIYDTISANELLRYVETSKYLDYYTKLDIYTKPGPLEGSALAYVDYRVCFVDHEEEFPGYENLYICRDEQGNLYIKNEANFTEEENQYIAAVNAQDDVVELNNRVNVEYNELMIANPSLLEYLYEMGDAVKASIGVALAEQNVDADGEDQGGESVPDDQTGSQNEQPQEPTDTTPEYATATTKVNVRKSDSEQADKLGSVDAGTRVQVQEVRVNGWTKVIYEGNDGYIKSDYLEFAESAAGMQTIGTVTATTNINIRAAANETADRLGLLLGGESLDLIAVEGDWCKVVYNGQVAYVKAEFVEQQ